MMAGGSALPGTAPIPHIPRGGGSPQGAGRSCPLPFWCPQSRQSREVPGGMGWDRRRERAGKTPLTPGTSPLRGLARVSPSGWARGGFRGPPAPQCDAAGQKESERVLLQVVFVTGWQCHPRPRSPLRARVHHGDHVFRVAHAEGLSLFLALRGDREGVKVRGCGSLSPCPCPPSLSPSPLTCLGL